MILKLDHFVITTADVSRCIAFYETLGFRSQKAANRWELYAGDFKLNVHLKGQELEPKAVHVQPGSADLCFEIDKDLRLLKERLKQKKVCTETDIVKRRGVRGDMESVYLRDPDGNLIELCRYGS